MNFQDQGIIISKRQLKERSYIITVFSQNHGIYSGVVRQYSKKMGDNLLEGNLIDFSWNARLHEHIGYIKAELVKSYYSTIISNKTNLYAFNSIISLLKLAFCERQPHNNLFPALLDFICSLKQGFSFRKYIEFELEILSEAGYKLQLDRCAVTNKTEDLFYVSPKSGRAVSKSAGIGYENKLLKLPSFLQHENDPSIQGKNDAITLTSYFMYRYIFQNKPEPKERASFLQLICPAITDTC